MDYVISSRTGNRYEISEYTHMSDEAFEEMFGKHVPQTPFMDPIIDPLAIYLYKHKSILEKLIFHIKKYDCYDPIYVKGNIQYPTQFAYQKEFIKFRDNALDEEFRDDFIKNWKKNVGMAIAKLTGNFYTSAGAN